MKTSFIILSLAILFNNLLYSQVSLQWQKNYGSSSGDTIFSITPTSDGGYIMAGQSDSTGGNTLGNHGGIDYLIVKTDSEGNIEWQKCFGGSKTDIARSIKQTIDGGYIVVGISQSIDGDVKFHGRNEYGGGPGGNSSYYLNNDGFESWVIKLTASASISWSKCLHEYDTDFYPFSLYRENLASFVTQTKDGDYIIAGDRIVPYSEYGSDVDRSIVITKLNGEGTILWKNTNLGSGVIIDPSICENDSGYVYAGTSNFPFEPGMRDCVVGMNLNGSLFPYYKWSKVYGGTRDDKSNSIIKTLDGGYVIAGYTESNDVDIIGNHGRKDFWILKLDSNGIKQWSKCFGGSLDDEATGIIQNPDGTYYVAGSSYSSDGQVTNHIGSSTQPDCWIIKIDADGNLLWSKSYGGTGADNILAMNKIPDGFIIAGSSASTDGGLENIGKSDGWVLKFTDCALLNIQKPVASNQNFCYSLNPAVKDLSASGTNLKWYSSVNETVPLEQSAILHDGNYYVSQTINGCESERTSVQVKILQTCPLQANIFPNPGNGNITFSISSVNITETAKIQISDATGLVILKRVIQNNNGTLSTIINTASFASGIYTIKYLFGNTTGTVRMSVIK